MIGGKGWTETAGTATGTTEGKESVSRRQRNSYLLRSHGVHNVLSRESPVGAFLWHFRHLCSLSLHTLLYTKVTTPRGSPEWREKPETHLHYEKQRVESRAEYFGVPHDNLGTIKIIYQDTYIERQQGIYVPNRASGSVLVPDPHAVLYRP